MRSFVIAALMTALVAGLGYAIAPGVTEPGAAPQLAASEAAGEEAAGTAVEGGEGENAAELTGAGAPAATKSTFYQWTDERGSVRFARSLDEVPPAWRERAGQVEVDAAAFTKSNPAVRSAQRQRFTQASASAGPSRYHDVTIYTAPWCGWCRKTIAWLDQRDIDYTNKDIEADEEHAAELVKKSGGRSIPFVEIDGTQIRGFNPNEMAALLD